MSLEEEEMDDYIEILRDQVHEARGQYRERIARQAKILKSSELFYGNK